MAVAFRSASALASATEAVTIDKPAGCVDNDILLAEFFAYKSSGSPVVNTLAGWTALGTAQNTSSRAHQLFWKRASTEGASYAWTATAGSTLGGAIVCYSGCPTSSNPYDVYSDTAYITNDTTLRAASVTPTVPNCMIVFLGHSAGTATSATPPTGWTERLDSDVGEGANLQYVAEYQQVAAAAVGAQDATLNAADSTGKGAWLVALVTGGLGLTWGQIGIGTTIYSDLRAFNLPDAIGERLVHVPTNSTVFPTKELGHKPSDITGTILITAASVAAFVADVRTGTAERRISFMLGAVECYGYAYSGDITGIVCLTPHGSVTRQYDVSFSFPLSRSKIYNASTGTVLWGS